MRALHLLVMLGLALAIGAASASYQGMSWKTDVEAVRARLERASKVREREGELKSLGITLEQFRAALAEGAVIIDARSPQEFAAGHVRVDRDPPTLNVFPDDGIEPHVERLSQLAGADLVLYCTSLTCDLAEDLYLQLENAGLLEQFGQVRIFFGGWEELEKTDLPRATGPDTWTGLGGELPIEDADVPGDEGEGELPADEAAAMENEP